MFDRLVHVLRSFLLDHLRIAAFLGHILVPVEKVTKIPVFGCHTCGQCVLHYTGLTCPMECPKNLRNGPCGGVRLDNHCEVKPEMVCVWFKAYNRSQKLFWPDEIHQLRPPVDRQLKGTSSWMNYLTGRDQIPSGCRPEPESGLDMVDTHG